MSDKKIGLIAGGGDFPILIAREAKALGYDVIVAGLKTITPVEIESFATSIEYFKLGQVSAPIEFFKKNNVSQAIMAGNVSHVSIFGGIMPDLRAAKILLQLKDKRANAILSVVAAELAKDGIELINSAAFLGNLLPEAGLLTGPRLSGAAQRSLELGWKCAKASSALDIGLTVVVRDNVVIAVEAMEGTDKCISRAGEILRAGGVCTTKPLNDMIVVKVARPDQDMRFDLPVVGLPTLESMREAGAGVLAIEAKKTLIFQKETFLSKAKAYGITVTAIMP